MVSRDSAINRWLSLPSLPSPVLACQISHTAQLESLEVSLLLYHLEAYQGSGGCVQDTLGLALIERFPLFGGIISIEKCYLIGIVS